MIKVSILPYIHHMAYASGLHSSDYMIDQILHGLSNTEDVKVQQIPKSPIMYKDSSKEEISKSWGFGFTLYGLLENNQENFDVAESDLIVCPLHHTMCNDQIGYFNFIKEIKEFFKKPTIAVDGWDQPNYLEETAQLVPYFKRELYNDGKHALPIFFAIPKEKIYQGGLDKVCDFSPMVPANHSWGGIHLSNYRYDTEEEYYKQYQKSFFAYSCKKGGWATGRQNEIIANYCIPFITDIEKCPTRCLYRYPKDLCIEAKRMKGVYPGTIHPYNPEMNTFIGDTRQIKEGDERGYINHDELDYDAYWDLVHELHKYLYDNLTTEALAKYILEKSL